MEEKSAEEPAAKEETESKPEVAPSAESGSARAASRSHSGMSGVGSLIRAASDVQKPATRTTTPASVPEARPAPAPRPAPAVRTAPSPRPAPSARSAAGVRPVAAPIVSPVQPPAPAPQAAPAPRPAAPAPAAHPEGASGSDQELRDFLRGKTVTELVRSVDGGFEVGAGTVIDDAVLDAAAAHDAVLMLAVSVDA